MIDLLNKLFSRFNVKKEKLYKEKRSFLDDIINSPEFMNKYPDFLNRYFSAKKDKSLYIGDIQYIQYTNGKTYYRDHLTQNYFCDYDMKKPSKEVLGHMIAETTFTPEELQNKLKE